MYLIQIALVSGHDEFDLSFSVRPIFQKLLGTAVNKNVQVHYRAVFDTLL